MVGRVGCGALLCIVLGAVAPSTAHAEPQWLTDLRAKADRWQQDLLDALDRLEAAAGAAGTKLGADARRHLDELLELLRATASAAEHVLAENAEAYRAVVAARLDAAAQVAHQLERQLADVVAGVRTQLDVDRRRLVTGARDVVASTLHDAQVTISEAHLVDGEVVARAVAQTRAEAGRWLWLVLAAGGLIVVAVGIGALWPRRLASDGAARRWITTAIGVVILAGGTAMIAIGVSRWRLPAADTSIAVGVERCDALAGAQALLDRGTATRPARTAAIAGLERCLLLVADTSSAELVADRLHRVHQLPVTPGGSP